MYGVEPDSKYIKADLGDGVYISTAYADKYQVEPGDKITLKAKIRTQTLHIQSKRSL